MTKKVDFLKFGLIRSGTIPFNVSFTPEVITIIDLQIFCGECWWLSSIIIPKGKE